MIDKILDVLETILWIAMAMLLFNMIVALLLAFYVTWG